MAECSRLISTPESDSEECHLACLKRLCRICGALYSRDATGWYLCANYRSRIEKVFKVNIGLDKDDIHPKMFCKSCYRTMSR